MAVSTEIELCLASQHFFPTHGGAQLRFLRYLPGFRQRGIRVQVLAGTSKSKKATTFDSDQDYVGLPTRDLFSGIECEEIPIHRIRLPERAGWRRAIVFNHTVLQFCRRKRCRPDVVQIVSSLQPRSIPWLIGLRRLGIPVVYGYTIAAELPSNPLRRAYRAWSLRRLYRYVECVVVGSSVMRDSFRMLSANARIEVIPNGVDLQRFRPEQDSNKRTVLRRSLGIGATWRVITTVGAVHPRKGSDLLLESWVSLARRFPEAHLFLVGLRKDLHYPELAGFRGKLQALVAASGAPERLHFPGLVTNVEEYLRASDLFVFPSRREGMPNVVLEAMASGLPVVMAPFVGLSEDFGKAGREYLLVDRDPDAVAAAIGSVLEDDILRMELGVRARQWVEKTMDVERSLDRYADLYRELADGARARRVA
jgi:glycosyltransferase involved in cell wall biosynthesis